MSLNGACETRANVLDESGRLIVPLQFFLRPKGGGDN